MEKRNRSETHEEYMDRIRKRHERMDILQKKGQKLCMAEDSLKEWKKETENALKEIDSFQNTLKDCFWGDYGPTIRVQTCNLKRGNEWTTLYQYQMNNMDDLIELITDRLFDRLEEAIKQTNRLTEEINNMHADKWN